MLATKAPAAPGAQPATQPVTAHPRSTPHAVTHALVTSTLDITGGQLEGRALRSCMITQAEA